MQFSVDDPSGEETDEFAIEPAADSSIDHPEFAGTDGTDALETQDDDQPPAIEAGDTDETEENEVDEQTSDEETRLRDR